VEEAVGDLGEFRVSGDAYMRLISGVGKKRIMGWDKTLTD